MRKGNIVKEHQNHVQITEENHHLCTEMRVLPCYCAKVTEYDFSK
jgi:hypothetical protein